MKKREFQALAKKDTTELEKLLEQGRTEVMNLRFSHATGALEDPSRLSAAKRDVARLLTVLGTKRRAAGTAATQETTPAGKAEVTA